MEQEKNVKKVGNGVIFLTIVLTFVITTAVIIGGYKLLSSNNNEEKAELLNKSQEALKTPEINEQKNEIKEQVNNINTSTNNQQIESNTQETVNTNNMNEVYSEIILNEQKAKVRVKQTYTKNESKYNDCVAFDKKIEISINGKAYKEIGEETDIWDINSKEYSGSQPPVYELLKIDTISEINESKDYIVIITRLSDLTGQGYAIYIIDENGNKIGRIEKSGWSYVIDGNRKEKYSMGPTTITTYEQENGKNIECEYTIEDNKLVRTVKEIKGEILIPGKM